MIPAEAGGPIVTEGTVQPAWVDYNGHMNYGYYVIAFDRPTDALFDHLELGASYRAMTKCTIYVVETHLAYLGELKTGDRFVVETILAACDPKRLHLFQCMLDESGKVCATSEILCLHVDQSAGVPRAIPLDEGHAALARNLVAAQASYPRDLGRSISLPFRPADLQLN